MKSRRLCDRLEDEDFLTWDGPLGVAVAPDDTRANFLRHLGLKESIWQHKRIYYHMRREAKAAMNRLFGSRKSLRPELVDDESIVSPFSLNQISELAFQEEVERIYETACSSTRGVYEITRTEDKKNWVIRWMLWRVIRKAEERASRAESSDAETDGSIGLTTASTAEDYLSVRAESTSPRFSSPTFLTAHSPHAYDDDWEGDERPAKFVKLDPDAQSQSSSKTKRPIFWDHVMIR